MPIIIIVIIASVVVAGGGGGDDDGGGVGLWWCTGGRGGGGGCGCSLIVAIWGLFGDLAYHVISVSTCCLNTDMQLWASSSAVKGTHVSAKVRGSNPGGNIFIL